MQMAGARGAASSSSCEQASALALAAPPRRGRYTTHRAPGVQRGVKQRLRNDHEENERGRARGGPAREQQLDRARWRAANGRANGRLVTLDYG